MARNNSPINADGSPGERPGLLKFLPMAFWFTLSIPVVKHLGGVKGLPSINADHIVLYAVDGVLLSAWLYLLWRAARAAGAGVKGWFETAGRLLRPDLCGWALLALGAASALSAYNAPQPALTLVSLADVARLYLVYALFRGTAGVGFPAVAAGLLLVTAAQAVLCLVEFSAQTTFGLWEKPGFGAFVPGLGSLGLGNMYARGGGTFEPNVISQLLQTALPFGVAAFLAAPGKWRKAAGAAAVVVMTAALSVTFSRGGWLGAGVALAVAVGAAWITRTGSRAGRLTATLFSLLLAAPAAAVIVARGIGGDDASALSRVDDWAIALAMIRDHPLWGVGRGNYLVLAPLYNPWAFAYPVHNVYLFVWAETGLAGLAAFVAVLVGAVRSAWRRFAGDTWEKALAAAALAAFAGLMFRMFVSMSFVHPLVSLTFVALAGTAARFPAMAER